MDENSKPLDDEEISWYDERSNECSPSIPHPSSFAMGLREGSVNQKGQPLLKSPLAKQTTSRSMTRLGLRSDNVDQSRYIEHLESQLVSAQAKIDTLMSPKTNKMRSAKLRSLTVENHNLRTESSGWAKKAEEMVQQEKLRYADLKVEIKSRLQALEEDLEVKDARIAHFEWELESMRAQVKDAEGLEEANANLEKKIDMLSSMLVNSPDKLESHSVATSPSKCLAQFSPSKRTPRPISMLSRVSSSPPSTRLSLASVSETAFWDSKSRSTSIIEAPEDLSPLGNQDEQAQSEMSDGGMISPDPSKRFSYSGSYYDHRNSTSYGSQTGPSSSRPTSFMSTSSMGAPSWGVPMLPDGEYRFSNRQRRMRKFPSGSSTLKPLILPVATTANVQSLPASASIYPSIDTIAKQDVSDSSSTDPNMSFMSGLFDTSQNSTSAVSSWQRSAKSIREHTLNALEGKHKDVGGEGKEFDEETCVASGSSPETESVFSRSHDCRRVRPKSLQKELEQAEVEQAHLNALGISAPDAMGNDLMSGVSRSSSCQYPMHLRQPNSTPRASPKFNSSSELNPPSTLKTSKPSFFNPTPDNPQSLFARITGLVTQTKQDPSVLARRILVNAWKLGSASMGGMGWWLIGPLHHHQRYHAPESSSDTDSHHLADGSLKTRPRSNGNWQHFSTEIRDGRVVDSGPAREYGGTWVTPPRLHSHDEPDKNNAVPPFLPGSSRGEPHLFPCDECVEPSSRRTLRMWFQFSLTVVLAVGLAVKYGPGVLLADLSDSGHTAICSHVVRERMDEQQQQQQQQQQQKRRYQRIPSQSNEYDTIKLGAAVADKSKVPSNLLDSRESADSGYGSVAFAEVLGPADFEAR